MYLFLLTNFSAPCRLTTTTTNSQATPQPLCTPASFVTASFKQNKIKEHQRRIKEHCCTWGHHVTEGEAPLKEFTSTFLRKTDVIWSACSQTDNCGTQLPRPRGLWQLPVALPCREQGLRQTNTSWPQEIWKRWFIHVLNGRKMNEDRRMNEPKLLMRVRVGKATHNFRGQRPSFPKHPPWMSTEPDCSHW